jgi:taurine dioxygenase
MVGVNHVTVRPMAGAIGAEVDGIDLADVSERDFAAIRAALLEHQVLFFHDQRMTPEQHKAFGRRFGKLYVHPYAKGLEGHHEVLPVLREPTDTGRVFGGAWHTDLTFEPAPVMASILYARQVPDHGGDTMFASQFAAHDALSDGLKRTLEGMKAVHSADAAYSPGKLVTNKQMGVKAAEAGTEAAHPIIRVHPESGRRALFVSRQNTDRFEGWTHAESQPLLNYLCEHATRPEFTCRFRWRSGSVAFWDNRCTQHLAISDYAGSRREMHRVTICGDTPRGVTA